MSPEQNAERIAHDLTSLVGAYLAADVARVRFEDAITTLANEPQSERSHDSMLARVSEYQDAVVVFETWASEQAMRLKRSLSLKAGGAQ